MSHILFNNTPLSWCWSRIVAQTQRKHTCLTNCPTIHFRGAGTESLHKHNPNITVSQHVQQYITFVVLEHHVVACTSPPSGRTSNGRSLRCRRTVDVNQYTVRASPRGFGALGGQRRAALVGCVSGLDRRCSGGLRTCISALFVHYSSHHWGLGHEDPRFTP